MLTNHVVKRKNREEKEEDNKSDPFFLLVQNQSLSLQISKKSSSSKS